MNIYDWLAVNITEWPDKNMRYAQIDDDGCIWFCNESDVREFSYPLWPPENIVDQAHEGFHLPLNRWQEERYRLGLDKRPTQRITLQPGDYIETKGVSEADYEKVYAAFCNAAIYTHKEELSYREAVRLDYFGASLFRQTNCFHSGVVDDENVVVFTRLLTVDQVINATNAKPQPGEWIEWSGGECPVSYETLVECRNKTDPEGADTRPACLWDWDSKTNPITHYRIVDNKSTYADNDDTEMVDISYQERDGGVAIITTPSSAESLDTLHDEVLELQKEMAHIEAIMTEKKARIMEILGDVFED